MKLPVFKNIYKIGFQDFDYGKFTRTKGGRTVINERQSKLIMKLFDGETRCHLSQVSIATNAYGNWSLKLDHFYVTVVSE